MCENCFSNLPQVRPNAALITRTRKIEATLPGERVADAAFAVFFGQRGGSIPWEQYQRLLHCMQAAMARPGLQCDDAEMPAQRPEPANHATGGRVRRRGAAMVP